MDKTHFHLEKKKIQVASLCKPIKGNHSTPKMLLPEVTFVDFRLH